MKKQTSDSKRYQGSVGTLGVAKASFSGRLERFCQPKLRCRFGLRFGE